MHRLLIAFRRPYSLRPMNLDAVHCLQPRERMHALVYRERARSDRSSHPFALVLFRMAGCSNTHRDMRRLARTALRRARITDDIGWFDGRTLATLLADTDTQGAWSYVDGVQELFAARCQRHVDVMVYTYPTNWIRKVDDGALEASSQPAGVRVRQGMIARDAGAAAAARELAMEQLFVRPIPAGKRLFDIVAASLILVLVSPVLLFAAAAIWLLSPGPIIFRQQRAGLGGVPFTMYKFRSMYIDAEERMAELRKYNESTGPVFKMKDDPRITPVGRVLRKTSIDELPQLLNVLKGDMSLVGPRPPIIAETKEYESWQCRRLEVTPGITCIWQVSGRSNLSFEQWMRMDTQYASMRSALTDLKLLLRTVPAVFLQRGAE